MTFGEFEKKRQQAALGRYLHREELNKTDELVVAFIKARNEMHGFLYMEWLVDGDSEA